MAKGNCFVSSTTKTGERVDNAKTRVLNLMYSSPDQRSAQDILDILRQSRLVDPASKLTETIFVNKSSGRVSIYDQVDGLQSINRFVRNNYKIKEDLLTVSGISKSNRQSQGIPLSSIHFSIKGEAQGYATVKINEDVLASIPQTIIQAPEEIGPDPMIAAMERLSETEMGKRYASAISTYLDMARGAGINLDQAIDSEMALRENSSDNQLMSMDNSTINPKTIEGQVEKLRQNFAKAGVRVKVTFDDTLDALGDAAKITDPDYDAEIRLNPDRMQNDTGFHEFGHLYIDLLGYNHPLVQAAIAQLRGTELYAKVESIYSASLKGNREKLDKEVLATAIGLNGAKIDTKNPSKFQTLLNKLFRALGKVFGIEPNAAAQLAEDMFAGNIRTSEFRGSLSFEKQFSLDPMKKAIQTARIATEEQYSIALRSKDPTSKRFARQLKFYSQRLETIKEAEDFMDFVDFINNLFNETESTFEEVKKRFHPGIDETERLELIQMLGNISTYLRSYFDSSNKKGIMKNIRDAAAEKLDLLKKSPNVTQQQLNNINALYNKIVALNDKMELVYDDYMKTGVPLQALLILKYHVSTPGDVNDQLESLADNVERTGILRTLIKNDEYRQIVKDRKAGVITKAEEKKLIVELNAKQIRAKKIGYAEIVAQLTNAQLDKSWYSALFDPIIYSSQTGLQLFTMEIKDAYLTAANATRETQYEIAPEYKKFLESKSGMNAAAAYRNMYETVTHYVRKMNDKGVFEYKTVEALSFVQEYDVSKYNKNLRDEIEAAGKNWGRPPYTDKVALDEWKNSNDARFVNLRKGYYQQLDKWHATNSQEGPYARQRLADLRAEEKRVEREYLRWKTSDPGRASLAFTELEAIKSEISFIYNEYNDTFRGDAVMPSSAYLNPRYKELQKDPAAFSYYQTLVKAYHERGQKKLGKTNQIKNDWDEYSYIIPSVEGDKLGQMQSSGFLEASKEMLKESFSITDGDTEFGELVGDKRDIVPIFFTGEMNAKLVTRDLTGAVMQFVRMADLFEAKSKIHSSVILMRDIIKERKVLKVAATGIPVIGNIAKRLGYVEYETDSGEASNVYKQVNNYIESMFYGRKENAVSIQNPFSKSGKNININKATNTFAAFTAKKVLALNLLQSTNQLLLDNYKLLEEGITGQFFNVANRTWAEGKAWSSGLLGVSDWGAFAAKSKLIKAAMWSDAYSDQLSGMSFNVGSKTRQAATGNWGHILQSSAEHHVVIVRMLAMMDSYKGKLLDKSGNVILNKDGSEANLYDLLIEKPNGTLELDPRVANMTQLQFVNKLSALVKKTNQVKGDFDRSAIEREWYGKLIMLFRKFFAPGLRKSWGYGSSRGVHVDTESGFIGGGIYPMLLNFISGSVSNKLQFRTRFKSLEEYEKRNLIRAFTNVGGMITTSVLGGMLYSDDEDDKVQNFFAYQAIRMNAELSQFLKPDDFFRILKSPTATMNFAESMYGLVEQLFLYDIPYELGFSVDKKNVFFQRKTGRFRQGERKIKKKLYDNVPFVVGVSKSGRPEDALTFYNR